MLEVNLLIFLTKENYDLIGKKVKRKKNKNTTNETFSSICLERRWKEKLFYRYKNLNFFFSIQISSLYSFHPKIFISLLTRD